MSFKNDDFQRQWEAAENEWKQFLAQLGCQVIHSGKDGGLIKESQGAIIAPDLQAFHKPTKLWSFHDVKLKTKPSYLRKWSQWRQGTDYYNCVHYKTAGETYGSSVIIAIKEENSPQDETTDFPCVPNKEPVWLAISITKAFSRGTHDVNWPGGKNEPKRRGKNGQGGLIWNRAAMTRIDINDISSSNAIFDLMRDAPAPTLFDQATLF